MRATIVATLVPVCLGVAASAVLPSTPVAARPDGPTRLMATACQAPQRPSTAGGPESGAERGGAPVQVALATTSRRATVRIRVFAHVLRTAARGGVPRSRILRQIAVLDDAFAGRQSPLAAMSPFRFRLADVDVTVNRAWYRMNKGSLAERRAKHALHRGTRSDLNLYIGQSSSGELGWGTQPGAHDEEPWMDGVVIMRRTMPGGAGGRYSAGDSAVHESGHWLGLFHTFAGGCTKPGDRVADTPREARPSYLCTLRRNTCAAPGLDPVHNFMDYGTDSCMNQFTRGQVTRMVHSWERLRATGSA